MEVNDLKRKLEAKDADTSESKDGGADAEGGAAGDEAATEDGQA